MIAARLAVAVGVVALAAPAAASARPVRVAPAAGGPQTDFRVGFDAPRRAYTKPETRERLGYYQHYVVSADGPAGEGCLRTVATTVTRARRGRVRVTLGRDPAGTPMCAGQWRGSVVFVSDVICGRYSDRCPLRPAFTERLERFRFRVVAG